MAVFGPGKKPDSYQLTASEVILVMQEADKLLTDELYRSVIGALRSSESYDQSVRNLKVIIRVLGLKLYRTLTNRLTPTYVKPEEYRKKDNTRPGRRRTSDCSGDLT